MFAGKLAQKSRRWFPCKVETGRVSYADSAIRGCCRPYLALYGWDTNSGGKAPTTNDGHV